MSLLQNKEIHDLRTTLRIEIQRNQNDRDADEGLALAIENFKKQLQVSAKFYYMNQQHFILKQAIGVLIFPNLLNERIVRWHYCQRRVLSQSFSWFVSFQSKSEEGEQQDKKIENCEMRMEGLEVIAFVRWFAQNTT